MIDELRAATAFSRIVHDGALDKAGEPYLGHIERVERYGASFAVSAGLDAATTRRVMTYCRLHDAVEDTATTLEDLAGMGYCEATTAAVDALTKREGEAYGAAIERIVATGDIAVILTKLADNWDNGDPRRLAALDAASRTRLEAKYAPARKRLVEAAEGLLGHEI